MRTKLHPEIHKILNQIAEYLQTTDNDWIVSEIEKGKALYLKIGQAGVATFLSLTSAFVEDPKLKKQESQNVIDAAYGSFRKDEKK